MTVRPIDTASAAIGDDAQLASAVLTYVADTAAAAQVEATRSCGAAYNANHPLILHSMPFGSDGTLAGDADYRNPADDKGASLYLWKTGDRPNHIVVTVEASQLVSPDGTVELYVVRLDQFLERRHWPPACDSVNPPSGLSTITLSSEGVGLSPNTMYAVLVGYTSALGTTRAAWYDSTTLALGVPTGGTALDGWYLTRVYAKNTATGWWDGTSMVAHDNTTVPYLLEIVGGSAAGLTAQWSEGGKSASVLPFPSGRLAMRHDTSFVFDAGLDVAHVWPPFEERHTAFVLASTDWVVRTPLSYLKVYGVNIREVVRTMPTYGTILEPERPTSYQASFALDAPVRATLEAQQRVWAVAPTPRLVTAARDHCVSDDDGARAGGAEGYRSVAHPIIKIKPAATVLFRVPVGEPHRWEDEASVTWAQARYRVTMVLMVIGWDNRPGFQRTINIKAALSDLDGTGATTEVTHAQDIPLTIAGPTYETPDAGYWWGLGDKDIGTQVRAPFRHSGQSLWNKAVLKDLYRHTRVASFDIADDGTYALEAERRLIVTADFADSNAPIQYLMLQALHVEALSGFNTLTSVETV